MKKKTFYQTNVLWQLLCLIFLVAFITCFIVGVQLIIGIINKGLGKNAIDIIISVVLLVLYFTGVLLMLKVFISLEHNNIHFTKEKIYMNDDWNTKKDKIQYYSEVKYINIESVDIIWTKKNSKGKFIKSRLLSAYVVKPYLSIKNKKGEVINFFIMYISKKDVIKIIKEISIRMKSVGNYINIINEDEALSKINKKIYIDI